MVMKIIEEFSNLCKIVFKWKLKNLITLLVCLLSLNLFAQNQVFLKNKKPGRLKKELPKSNIESIINLKVEGYLNNKDLEIISNMINLTILDVSGVIFIDDDYKKGKREYYNGMLNLKSIPKLKTLIFSSQEGDIKSMSYAETYAQKKHLNISSLIDKRIDFSTVPQTLKELHISADILESFSYDVPDGIKFDKVIITKGHRYYSTYKNPFIVDANNYYEITSFKERAISDGIYIKTLFLPSYDYLEYYYETKKKIDPVLVYTEKEKDMYLVKWDKSVTQEELLKVNKICPFAFYKSELSEIKFSNSVKFFPMYCFAECTNLKSVIADGIEYIGKNAFQNTSLTNYSFNENIKRISISAFSGSKIKKVNFHGSIAPKIDDINYGVLDHFLEIEFTVPKGSIEYYSLGLWKNFNVIEEGVKTDYEFILKQPGTLHKFITDSISKCIKNLTIKGVLYDNDFESIKKCKNLKSINLKDCFITLSPETIKSKQAEQKAMAALLGFIIDEAKTDIENKYNTGDASFGDILSINLFDILFDNSVDGSKLNKLADIGIENEMPRSPFEGLNFIEKIVFPDQMKKMNCSFGTSALKEIVLPSCLEELSGHIICGVSILKFPSSLKTLGNYVFTKNQSLRIVDLSNTQVEEIGDGCFDDCDYIEIFKGSPVLKKCSIESKIAYFYTKESNNVYLYDYKEVHIPIGCKSGWQKRLEYRKLIDDIAL